MMFGEIPWTDIPSSHYTTALKLHPSNFGNGMLYCASLCMGTRQPRDESCFAVTQHVDEELKSPDVVVAD